MKKLKCNYTRLFAVAAAAATLSSLAIAAGPRRAPVDSSGIQAGVVATLRDWSGDINTINNNVTNLGTTVTNQGNTLGAQITNVDGRVTNLGTTVTNQGNTTNSRIDSVNSTVTNQGVAINGLNGIVGCWRF